MTEPTETLPDLSAAVPDVAAWLVYEAAVPLKRVRLYAEHAEAIERGRVLDKGYE